MLARSDCGRRCSIRPPSRPSNAGDGNLYRNLWPSADTTSTDAEAALKTNDDPEVMDVSDSMAFNDVVAASTDADFATLRA